MRGFCRIAGVAALRLPRSHTIVDELRQLADAEPVNPQRDHVEHPRIRDLLDPRARGLHRRQAEVMAQKWVRRLPCDPLDGGLWIAGHAGAIAWLLFQIGQNILDGLAAVEDGIEETDGARPLADGWRAAKRKAHAGRADRRPPRRIRPAAARPFPASGDRRRPPEPHSRPAPPRARAPPARPVPRTASANRLRRPGAGSSTPRPRGRIRPTRQPPRPFACPSLPPASSQTSA